MLNEHGVLESVPSGWELLPPGDPALSRRIKQDGPSWSMAEMKGRKRFSRGIWAPADRLAALRAELLLERQAPSHQQKLDRDRQRRAVAQEIYAGDFRRAVFQFLDFHRRYRREADVLAGLIAAHAVPVGSGTVARTRRIPLEQRASAATVAWLRHQTTDYDRMTIAPEQGRRHEVRHELAQRSLQLLLHYRQGQAVDSVRCPLQRALRRARVEEVVEDQPPLF